MIILFSTETPPVLVQNMTATQLNSAVLCNSSGQNITGPLEMAVKVNGSQRLCSRALLKTVPPVKTARAFFFKTADEDGGFTSVFTFAAVMQRRAHRVRVDTDCMKAPCVRQLGKSCGLV